MMRASGEPVTATLPKPVSQFTLESSTGAAGQEIVSTFVNSLSY